MIDVFLTRTTWVLTNPHLTRGFSGVEEGPGALMFNRDLGGFSPLGKLEKLGL